MARKSSMIGNRNGRTRVRGLLLCLGVFFAASTPGGSAAAEWQPCAQGIELRLTPEQPTQGNLVLVEVRSPFPLASLRGRWKNQRLRFWRAGNPASIQRALLGVDLDLPPGRSVLTLAARRDTGERFGCSALLTVGKGEFALERLQVPERFVELSPADRARARREGERLRRLWTTASARALWQGGFRRPLEGVEAAGNFGRRRVLNDQPRSPHGGEDFRAPAGTPVHAAQGGRVVLADELFFSGNTVVLDHGLGLYTFYGHLESLGVKEREVVEAGALVGRVGATGRVTGAHLHWAVRLNAARVNPLDLPALLARQ
ncbi:MAG: M23 family metallopeptidase [Terriglobia bacterium]